jgi:hypothetical protein
MCYYLEDTPFISLCSDSKEFLLKMFPQDHMIRCRCGVAGVFCMLVYATHLIITIDKPLRFVLWLVHDNDLILIRGICKIGAW